MGKIPEICRGEFMSHTRTVLSCIPKQYKTYDEKLAWLDKTMTQYNVDIFITPQEYFGGASMMEHHKAFTEDEVMKDVAPLCKKTTTNLVLGVQERLKNINKEAIWFINTSGKIIGKVYKVALPGYDHILTNGYGEIVPELDITKRFVTFQLANVNIGAIFCWEAFSNILWTGLSIEKPDIVASMIKFGANSWPIKEKTEKKSTRIRDFGYGTWDVKKENIWMERLIFANKYQVFCPIICSTNSWNLNPRSLPMAGTISRIPGQINDSLWKPAKNMKLKDIPEKIIVDTIDLNVIRVTPKNKFKYKDITGDWPPSHLGEYTMLFKIRRLEERLRKGVERKKVLKKLCSR